MTTSVGVPPGPETSAPAEHSARWRSRLDGAATPTRLRLLLALLILLSLGWGVLAALTADQHASAAADVVAVSEPLSLDAEQIFTSLSDADATAASAFLAGGLEPAQARQRYQADITQAAIRIQAASALVGSSAARSQLPGHLARQASGTSTAVGDDLATLSGQLPVYTGEVGTARADNRLGLPLGAAYLREASALLRGTLLPAARDINTRESALLTSASAQATGLPLLIVTVVAGLGIGYVFSRSSRWLARQTHRVVNYGLLVAALAGLVSLVWLAGAFVVGRSDLLHAQQQGSRPAQAFARAEVAALQAHADESLTLIDNSGDDAYQQDYLAQQKRLGPGPGTLLAQVQALAGKPGSDAAAEARAWYQAHAALRAKDNAGSHADAVQSALTGDAATRFASLSATLSEGVDAHQAVFASSARNGRDAFTGLAVGMIVASLVMVAGCARGLSRRLAEYR
jgi:F0F1-type ATP synthase membrane subunit c/vacuolar-type H+-ATPase subunit K